MSRRRLSTPVSIALVLAVALAIASTQAAGTAPKQPKIDGRAAPLLKVGNLSFKDLNRNGVLDPYEDWRLPVDRRVADLLSRMTLEEKAGLMQITSFNAGSLEDYLNQRNIRYLILRDNLTARELAARANTSQELAEKSRLGIPIVFASNPRNHVRDNLVYEEAEAAGEFSSWPGTLGLAATNDLKLIRAFAETARAEWRASGIQKCYGYQVDVATEPRWYRIQTTFGESPKWNAEIAREIVLGFQGPALGPESVAQSIKHFPGDGGRVVETTTRTRPWRRKNQAFRPMEDSLDRDGIRRMLGKASAVILAALLASGFTLQAHPQIVAWGSNLEGQTNVPPGLTTVVAIAAGPQESTVSPWRALRTRATKFGKNRCRFMRREFRSGLR